MRAIGTTALVAVTEPAAVEAAARILRDELVAIDRTCSRFRSDSELSALHRANGAPVRVSALLFDAITVACDVARRTGGAVDPTVGVAMEALGYDRDFDELGTAAAPARVTRPGRPRDGGGSSSTAHSDGAGAPGHPPRSGGIGQGPRRRPRRRCASPTAVPTAVLVSIGGDVATAGTAPAGGWAVGIATDSSTPVGDVDQVVSIKAGAIASSSTSVRTWQRGGRRLHHIVDPSTGDCAAPYWRLVSASGDSCVDANAASTAAVVWGRHAPCQTRRRSANRPVSCATTDRSSPSTGGRATPWAIRARAPPSGTRS